MSLTEKRVREIVREVVDGVLISRAVVKQVEVADAGAYVEVIAQRVGKFHKGDRGYVMDVHPRSGGQYDFYSPGNGFGENLHHSHFRVIHSAAEVRERMK